MKQNKGRGHERGITYAGKNVPRNSLYLGGNYAPADRPEGETIVDAIEQGRALSSRTPLEKFKTREKAYERLHSSSGTPPSFRA